MFARLGANSFRRPRIDFVHSARNGANQSSFTWNSVNYGAADPSRFLLIVVAMGGGGAITGITVDGVTPTKIADRSNGAGTDMKIYWIAKPTGTSGTIVTTGSSSPTGASITVHSVYNCNTTPKFSGAKAGAVSAFPSLALNPNDVVFYTVYGGSTTPTFTVATKTVDEAVNDPSGDKYACATLQASAAGAYIATSNVTENNWAYYFAYGK